MFELLIKMAAIILSVSILISTYRVFKGPTMPDRVIALDIIGINIIALVGVVSVWLSTQAFLEVILLIGILAFIGTISFSKFIERGVVIERKRD
ncbi:Na(+)/H(+) antiporter subunit F1 [Caldalkalibacillus salinus]|uniref:Na(+)/H(+) antiporter subunit F1 n=1 Tax=Caldalkalibacillus salinus TaxID=2803787 RepID=UPI00192353AE|nr:Na(+)/H(+) antiporter subunit F1 [Caldalkalibacillus salinus]